MVCLGLRLFAEDVGQVHALRVQVQVVLYIDQVLADEAHGSLDIAPLDTRFVDVWDGMDRLRRLDWT